MTRVLIVALFLLPLMSACKTASDAKRYVFVRPNLKQSVFQTDIENCRQYVVERTASEEEKGTDAAVGFLVGGLGGAMASSHYQRRINRQLFDECFYTKGYRNIEYPKILAARYMDEDGNFDKSRATMTLLEEERLDEVLLWGKAHHSGDPDLKQRYLEEYPDGIFAEELAKKMTE